MAEAAIPTPYSLLTTPLNCTIRIIGGSLVYQKEIRLAVPAAGGTGADAVLHRAVHRRHLVQPHRRQLQERLCGTEKLHRNLAEPHVPSIG